jgi:hypothetical protein
MISMHTLCIVIRFKKFLILFFAWVLVFWPSSILANSSIDFSPSASEQAILQDVFGLESFSEYSPEIYQGILDLYSNPALNSERPILVLVNHNNEQNPLFLKKLAEKSYDTHRVFVIEAYGEDDLANRIKYIGDKFGNISVIALRDSDASALKLVSKYISGKAFISLSGAYQEQSLKSFTDDLFSEISSLGLIKILNEETIVETFKNTSFEAKATKSISLPVLISTRTSLSSSGTTAKVGDFVTLTATVVSDSSVPVGSVVFKDGNYIIASVRLRPVSGALNTASASYAVNFKTSGVKSVLASFSGNLRFGASTSPTLNISVTDRVKVASKTTLSADKSSVPLNQIVTLKATVESAGVGLNTSLFGTITPVIPTGKVVFREGNIVIASATIKRSISPSSQGEAVVSVRTNILGTRNITAAYEGDLNFTPSTSNTIPVMVTALTKKDTKTTITVNSTTIPATKEFTITARVELIPGISGSDTITGRVLFKAGDKFIASRTVTKKPSSSGQPIAEAILITSLKESGSFNLTATYVGDLNYATSTSTVLPITITPAL